MRFIDLVSNVSLLGGLGLVSAGFWAFSESFGLISAGFSLVFVSYLMGRRA